MASLHLLFKNNAVTARAYFQNLGEQNPRLKIRQNNYFKSKAVVCSCGYVLNYGLEN